MYLAVFSPGDFIERITGTGISIDAEGSRIMQEIMTHLIEDSPLYRHFLAGLFSMEVRPGIWNGACELLYFVRILKACVSDLALDIACMIASMPADKFFMEALHKTNLPSTRVTDVYNFCDGNEADRVAQEQAMMTFCAFLKTAFPAARINACFVNNIFTVIPYSNWTNDERYLDTVFDEYRDWLFITEGRSSSFRVNHRDAYGILATRTERGFEGEGLRESP